MINFANLKFANCYYVINISLSFRWAIKWTFEVSGNNCSELTSSLLIKFLTLFYEFMSGIQTVLPRLRMRQILV